MKWRNRTTRNLALTAEGLGYEVRLTRNGHLSCRHPSGAVVILPSDIPTDRHRLNAVAALRRSLRCRGATGVALDCGTGAGGGASRAGSTMAVR